MSELNKENGDRLTVGEQGNSYSGQVGSDGVDGLNKKEKNLMDMDNSVVIAGGRGV